MDTEAVRLATPTELRSAAREWDVSAEVCDRNEWPILAARDRGMAAALRRAADILEITGAPNARAG